MSEELSAEIPEESYGQRIDQVLAELFPDFSRSKLQKWIKEGQVLVDGRTVRPKDKVVGGEEVVVFAEPEKVVELTPEDIDLDVVYEDEHIIVINKPIDMVVHPAAGNWSGTLLNGLLFHYPELENLPRAGLVHRLDKDTSGLLVVARSPLAHRSLVEQLQSRTMGREYVCIVHGTMISGGTVNAPIGRHPHDRKKMAVHPLGKEAITHYRISERFDQFTHLRVKLETGRTHQIRVHMAHIRHPIVGDEVYGARPALSSIRDPQLKEVIRDYGHQALHAAKLTLKHPATGEIMTWRVRKPQDMRYLLSLLRGEQREDDDDWNEDDYDVEFEYVP